MKYLLKRNNSIITGMVAFVAALFLFVLNPIEAHAYIQTQGTVVADSAVVRKDPSANSNVIASVMKGDKVTINNEETDSNGVIWYKVFVDSETMGYVRGDLIQKDGASAPITNTPSANTENSDSGNDSSGNSVANVTVGATTEVTPVESQGASITGDTVRVRAEASTNSSIVTQVKKGTAITVNGQATGSDGKVWYRASFIVDGAEVIGFIRNDFVQLSGEIVVIEESTTTENTEQSETSEPVDVPEEDVVVEETVNTDYELRYEPNAEGINEWYLYNNVEGVKNKLSEILDAAEGNGDAVEYADEQLSKQKTIIIVMAIIIVFMALGLTLMFFKIRDMYYDDFESFDDEHERPARNNSAEPRTVRPAQGERPAARPQNGQPRPQNGQPRPQNGQPRPQNGQPRPQNGQPRPQNGQPRPQNGQPRPQNGQPRPQNTNAKADTGWKAKNFMSEEDDFEFEFLNWEDSDK